MQGCASGSHMVVTLSDCKLRYLLKRYGRAAHLIEDNEAPGACGLRAKSRA